MCARVSAPSAKSASRISRASEISLSLFTHFQAAPATGELVRMPMKKKDIEKLLKKPIVAVVAVTAPDGAPHAVPTWFEYAGGQIVFHTGAESFKYKCLVRDPRVTLVVDTKKAPYKTVVLKGRATLEEKIDDKRTERMAVEYLGK